MKSLIVLLGLFCCCLQQGSAQNSSASVIPLRYLKTSGWYDAMQNSTAYVDKFMKMAERHGTERDISTGIGRDPRFQGIGTNPLQSVERSELAASLHHAGCQPYDQVVEVPNDKPNVLLFPACVVLKQCGGCCGHPALACKPVATKPITVKVLKQIYENGAAVPVNKVSYMQMSEHTTCGCQCKLTAADCNNELHVFDDWNCKCECRRSQHACAANKRWNENVCACTCSDVQNCGTGYIFNLSTCSCEESVERSIGGQVQPGSGVVQVVTTESPAEKACARMRCPRRYVPKLNSHGMCRCAYQRRRG